MAPSIMQWENVTTNNNMNRSLYTYKDSVFFQGISRVLSKWNALQIAIQNSWGGHDSYEKSHQLELDIFSWFRQSKASLCVEDLENLLHESMLFSFNTDIEDGSIEEVAEQLMILHEGCLNNGSYMLDVHIQHSCDRKLQDCFKYENTCYTSCLGNVKPYPPFSVKKHELHK